jgi:hypothetical protein
MLGLSNVDIAVAIVAVLVGVAILVMRYKNLNLEQSRTQLKQDVLYLFLYAEKQEWVNDEKMKWCIQKIYEMFPDSLIKKVISYETVEKWAQLLYDEFKTFIKAADKI